MKEYQNHCFRTCHDCKLDQLIDNRRVGDSHGNI